MEHENPHIGPNETPQRLLIRVYTDCHSSNNFRHMISVDPFQAMRIIYIE